MNEDCGSREVYEKKLEELQLSDVHSLEVVREKFLEFARTQPQKYAHISNCENCTGDFINNSRDCYECYDVSKSELCRNLQV